MGADDAAYLKAQQTISSKYPTQTKSALIESMFVGLSQSTMVDSDKNLSFLKATKVPKA